VSLLAFSVSSCFLCWGFRHLLAVVSPYKPWIWGPDRAHPRPCELAKDLWIWTLHLLCSQATTHSHTFIFRHPTFPPHKHCLGITVLFSLKVTWMTLGDDQASLLPLRGRPNIWSRVLTSLMSNTPLAGFCASPGSVVHPRPSPWLIRRTGPSSGSTHPLVPHMVTSSGGPEGHTPATGRCKATISEIPDTSPQKCCGTLKQRHGTLRQFRRKQCFIMLARTQWNWVQRLSLKNKEVSPYIPLQAGYRSKKQDLTHIWLYAIL
jgi:hypothetical protein